MTRSGSFADRATTCLAVPAILFQLACASTPSSSTITGRSSASLGESRVALPQQLEPRDLVVLRRFVETLDVIDLEGKRWAAESLRGRVILVTYWATWCPECWAELPTLRRLRERYTRSDFEIIGVSVDVTSRRDVVSWLNRHRLDWPQVHDGRGFQGDLARLLGVKSVPFSFLLDRQGRPVAVNLRGEALARAVDVLLAS